MKPVMVLSLLALTACTKQPASTEAKSGETVVLGASSASEAKGAPAMPGKNVPAIKVNTVGYPLEWSKVAVLNLPPEEVHIENEQGQAVWTAATTDIRRHGLDAASQDQVWQLDFSAFTQPGRFRIVSGAAKSDFFEIGAGVYKSALVLGQKHFYFQRCRSALKAPHAEFQGDVYGRETACHDHAEVGWDLSDFPEKKRRWKPRAGWHDAGNFEMYVPSTAPTAQALLMAYAGHPELFADGDLNIPESGNGVPDLLDEVRWGLDWVLSMQDRDGGFRHSETVRGWSEAGPADKETTPRWINGVGTAATAKATAALALAAKVFQPFDAEFAKYAEQASRAGWSFLEQHPERILVDLKGSEQPKWDDGPEFGSVSGARFVAAAEVWRQFRLPSALEQVRTLLADKETEPEQFIKGAWANLSRYGMVALATDPDTPGQVRDEAKQRLIRAAELLRSQIEVADGYRCASKPSDYYWGHNSNLLEKAHVLAVTAKWAPEGSWMTEAARDQWHWILGRNPNGYSMVTRVGKGPERMYHMEWGPRDKPAPGYLVGGPNSVQMSQLAPGAPAKALLWDNPKPLRSGLPAHSLWHSEQSDLWEGGFEPAGEWGNGWWSVTEPDILYNANLVLVAAEMQE